jgi:rhamnogalacturonan endolyase
MAAFLGLVLCTCCPIIRAQSSPGQAVTVTEDQTSYTLSNGIVTAKLDKKTGNIFSMLYKDTETLAGKDLHGGGFWSEDTAAGTSIVDKITIDPQSNNGDRAEVSIKGISGGLLMGRGGENGPNGSFPGDIEIRYCMERGASGVYTYYTWDHLPEYPAGSLPESRFACKLAQTFDWTRVDDARLMMEIPQAMNGTRYTYAATQFDHRAYGWVSSKQNIGWWLVQPGVDYMSGGPTKIDFECHRDTNQAAPPCVLNFWKAVHFGGGNVNVAAGEHWTKVIGPFFLYCNSGTDPIAIFNDAQAQLEKENAKWPYTWVSGVDYAQSNERTTVSGQIVLSDSVMPDAKMSNVLVGLAHAPYSPPAVAGRGGRGRGATTAPQAAPAGVPVPAGLVGGRLIDWQHDAKYYQFWTHGQDDGTFSIPNVRPGSYTLYAIADGVLGEYSKADITVELGKPIDLGKLTWTPIRYGRQIWDIGIPNRNAKDFAYGDKFFEYDTQLQYAKLFPNDVNFVIGQSDPRKDWYFEQVPHATNTNPPAGRGFGPGGSGKATPYNIKFQMPAGPTGKATLRVAICGAGFGGNVDVTVNAKPAGQIKVAGSDNVIVRKGNAGNWYERDVVFDAAMMKQGDNVLTLTVPAGPLNNGVVYDYLRLELDESSQATNVP